MNKRKKNISYQKISLFILVAFVMFFSIQTQAQTTNNILNLRYGDNTNFNRFVFDFEIRPDYKVSKSEGYTNIYFPENTVIKTSNLDSYKNHNLIKNQSMSDGKLLFSIPAKLLKSFEFQNKIIIDVEISESPNNSFQIDEIKTIEPENILELPDKNLENIPPKEEAEEVLKVKVDLQDIKDKGSNEKRRSASLAFPWTERVGLAVFQRGEHLWIVFDQNKSFNTTEIAKTTKGFVSEIMQIPNVNASILRLKLQEGISVNIRKEGLLWIIDLLNQRIDAVSKELLITTQYVSKNEAYIFVPTSNAGNVVLTVDPDIGDILMIAPVFDTNLNISNDIEYPEFDILPTIQGLVLEAFADDVLLARNNSGITIKAKNRGLNISHNLELLRQQALLLQEKDWIKNLTKELPMKLQYKNYITTSAELIEKASQASKENKNQERLNLARYYILKGLGTEAIGVLETVIESNEKESTQENIWGLLGIANFMEERYEEAVKNFSYGKLPELREAKFWKTISQNAITPSEEGNIKIATYIPVIREYPEEIKAKIATIGVKTALNVSDDITAQNFLDILNNSSSLRNYSGFIDYWSFELLSIQGYSKNAGIKLIEATKSSNIKYSSIARRKLAMIEYKAERRSLRDTINELERLKYAWGEESFRISLLEDLYGTYISYGDYYNAMKNMEILTKTYNSEYKKHFIENAMVQIFDNIFVNKLEGTMTPIKALALYHDFEWLINKSKNKAKITLNLSDRLFSIDLLDRARNILAKNINSKEFSSVEKAQIGLRLALINILQEDNLEAIKNIQNTKNDDLPEYINVQRRILEAKALTNLDRNKEALDLLGNDSTYKSNVLKAEIYQKTGQWSKASDCLKKLIDVPVNATVLSDEQYVAILNWLLAVRKANKTTSTFFAREEYLSYFEKSKYKKYFDFLTLNLEKDEIDLKNIHRIIEDVTNFNDFITTYNTITDN